MDLSVCIQENCSMISESVGLNNVIIDLCIERNRLKLLVTLPINLFAWLSFEIILSLNINCLLKHHLELKYEKLAYFSYPKIFNLKFYNISKGEFNGFLYKYIS